MSVLLMSGASNNSSVPVIATGETIRQRIVTPPGYEWVNEEKNSFGEFLQNISLKPHGTKILDYEGGLISNQSEHVAVLNFDIGKKDLQQCADVVIRMRAEYLYSQGRFDDIGFHFTSGHMFKWNDFKNGYRAKVSDGNRVVFNLTERRDDSYTNFQKYLDVIYMYAGTISLNEETVVVRSDNKIEVGNILITAGSPGHVIIICGRAKDKSGNMIYLLAQGYTPAQSMHIITNPYNGTLNPWYKISVSDKITVTARYTFLKTNIRAFR